MLSNITHPVDARSIKTKKALYAAMSLLLSKHSVKKITIKEICEEALISRATFYAHFVDKYDLLRLWIADFWPQDFNKYDTYEQIETVVNNYLHENMHLLKNLIYDADEETRRILFDFIFSTINQTIDMKGQILPKQIVLSNFYAGGILSYLTWQVENRFPPDVPPMNRYLYEMICELQDWHQNKG